MHYNLFTKRQQVFNLFNDDCKQIRQCLNKKQVENKSEKDGRNKNKIKLIVMGKNFSKTFKFKETSFDIIVLLVKFFYHRTKMICDFFLG